MGRDDWFRNETWDSVTEARFFDKLRRARDKAQPLRIQAGYLKHKDPRAALASLERYFTVGDHFDRAQAFLAQAEAYPTLGEQEEALQSLRNALKREFPNVKTQAWSRYALLVAERNLDHFYDERREKTSRKPVTLAFPPRRWFSLERCMCSYRRGQGLHKDVVQCATAALRFAELANSGFRCHPDVGLVENQIASSSPEAELAKRGAPLRGFASTSRLQRSPTFAQECGCERRQRER